MGKRTRKAPRRISPSPEIKLSQRSSQSTGSERSDADSSTQRKTPQRASKAFPDAIEETTRDASTQRHENGLRNTAPEMRDRLRSIESSIGSRHRDTRTVPVRLRVIAP